MVAVAFSDEPTPLLARIRPGGDPLAGHYPRDPRVVSRRLARRATIRAA